MSNRGKYIVVEGLDGCGKSTQFERLQQHFNKNTVSVREPGGTPMAEGIRTLLMNKLIPRSANTNMFLFSAARADLIDAVIRPSIEAGKNVLSDRSWLSSAAYQSAEGANAKQIASLNRVATGEFFNPDLLILIDADPKTCQQRIHKRGGAKADYFDSKDLQYFVSVRQAYSTQAKQLKNVAIVDGNGTPDQVWAEILQSVKNKGIKE